MLCETISIQVPGSLKDSTLTTYILDNSVEIDLNRTRPIIVICPGGGYGQTSDREAEALAIQFLGMGYHAAVMRYSCAPAVYPTALLELAVAVATIRDHNDVWHINSDKIIIQGSSAGGHLAASYGMFWHEAFLSEYTKTTPDYLKPNGMILGYPVITSGEFAHQNSIHNLLGDRYDEFVDQISLENHVSEYTPTAFIWHTFTDNVVPVENSLLLVNAMRKQGIPVEFHLYPVGGHGLALASEETKSINGGGVQTECQSWVPLVKTWLIGLNS